MLIISKAQAKAQGLRTYFTGIPCRHGHVAQRLVDRGDCIMCSDDRKRAYAARSADKLNAKSRAWYAANKEKAKLTRRQWRKENAEKDRSDIARYQIANKDRLAQAAKIWISQHKEHVRMRRAVYVADNLEKVRDQRRCWARKNPGAVQAKAVKRIAAKLRAMPAWADRAAIRAVYVECARITRETGVPHHVDHVYPLRSDWVCGLHVENNLQILPATVNLSKSNKPWFDAA